MEEKLEEVIAKFSNGSERFTRSAVFNQVVQTLARGGDEYKMIDILIGMVDSSQKAFNDHLTVCTHVTIRKYPHKSE